MPTSWPRWLVNRIQRWTAEPAAFAVDALGVRPWSKQRELLAAAGDPSATRIACRAGQKVSKSNTAAITALWWAMTRPGGRCIILAPTERQVKEVIWRELRLMKAHAPIPLGGELARDPGTGWRFPGESQIIGFSTDEPERLGGFSGPHVLFIVDEGSGVDDEMMEAIEGNMAGGARLLAIGNPTRISGWFYRAFHSERSFWRLLHVSSTDSPNVTGERNIPGLATPEWVEDMRAKWGAGSNWYRVRVLGEFPESEEDCLIPLAWIEAAVDRWRNLTRAGTMPAPDTLALDVAAGVGRDSGVIAASAGNVIIDLWASDQADTMEQTGRMYRGWQAGHRLVVDADGIGAGVAHRLRELGAEVDAYQGGESCDLSDESDELRFVNRRAWSYWRLRELLDPSNGYNVALPADEQLIEDLYAPRYKTTSAGKIQIEPKDAIRKRLGRSPDKGDAVVMALASPIDAYAPLPSFNIVSGY